MTILLHRWSLEPGSLLQMNFTRFDPMVKPVLDIISTTMMFWGWPVTSDSSLGDSTDNYEHHQEYESASRRTSFTPQINDSGKKC